MAVSSPQDLQMQQQSSPPALPSDEPRYGGFTRFDIELEFVQSLASPYYLNFLASQKYFDKPAFVAYLKYLLYFTQPPYLKFLSYPGPTLKHLELLQEESFRMAILSPDVMNVLVMEEKKAGLEWAELK